MNRDNLTRYIESGIADNKMLKKASSVELKESLFKCVTKLRESIDSESSEGWWVPISFYNKLNGNNRNYNRQLWENVLNNQKETYVGSPMLTDHPAGDSDGNPKDICGVWLDAKMDDPDANGVGLVWGLLVPSGRLGDDLKDHIKHGLKVGTSSSGFGRLLPDGVTVDPETYQIERLADFVLNPSQGTFFSYDESNDNIEDHSIRESTNKVNNNFKETIVKDSKIAKLEEKKFRRDMESFLESADNIKDPQARLEEFREIRSYLEDGACPDLREKIEAKISAEESSIKDMLNESMALKEQFGITSVKDLEEKLTMLAEDTKIIESESKDWKEIASKLQEKVKNAKEELDKRPSQRYVNYLVKKNSQLAEKINLQNKKAADVVQSLIEACEDANAKVAELEETIKANEEEKSALTEKLNKSTSYNTLAEKANNMNMSKYADLQEALNEAQERIKFMTQIITSQKRKLNEANFKLKKSNEIREDLKKVSEKKDRSIHSLLKDTRKLQQIQESQKSIEKEPQDPVEAFYESLYDTYGAQIEPFRKKILSAVNITEAKNIFYTDAIQNMRESRDIESTRIPKTSYISAEDRQEALGLQSIKKSGIVDRRPEGWI